jgi:hypothetical protein
MDSEQQENYSNRLATRGRTMNRDDAEIASYLRLLLEHQEQCDTEQCPSCLTLHGIYQQIRTRLFSDPVPVKAGDSAVSAARGR